MFGIGSVELVVILVVALLIFGPQRLPELARTLARMAKELRTVAEDIREQVQMEEILQENQGILRNEQDQLTSSESPSPDAPATPSSPSHDAND